MAIAVVTGASSGIGAATARKLAAQGYDVVVAARRLDLLSALADEIGARAVALDITSDASVAALAEAVPEVDLLVNNAGGALGADPVATASLEDWQRMYDVNVLGTLRVTKALLPALRAAGGGTIITVTSTAALITYEGGAGYTAAKHAERAMVETLRLELNGSPVRVVEIAPGMVHTEGFSLTRFGGDSAKADAVYADVDRPLVAADVAECIAFAAGLPLHVNIDRLVVRPLAQAAQHKLHRGPLFS
ncbi:SDR family NAD(P)-dependent oxidoreductase [Nocardioides cavernaquae]|uniref:SDR family NAD(P)-dependent oxidoreductase n=1 Tax=Nocardioides cavernaquae TaxID=2321396 RepID=A0A3A5H4D7_9ACTN|nr:SDR family NAD(P)-dependent oxidoreductase [Nocardioides cavernaquae]RJS45586.1 SDR family NAD(P)-dependent oxidoreductase [Nocardioides cavernaquae]